MLCFPVTIQGAGWTNQTIKQNADDIAVNTSNIATNSNNIGTNTGNIATNTSNITQNQNDITTIKGTGWTNQTIKQNADDIATNQSNISTNQSNIATNTSWRNDFNSQTTNNLLYRDGTDSFNNISYSNQNSNSTIVQRDGTGQIEANTFIVDDGTHTNTIDSLGLTASRTASLPDKTGTPAMIVTGKL